jgi:predicted peptidase
LTVYTTFRENINLRQSFFFLFLSLICLSACVTVTAQYRKLSLPEVSPDADKKITAVKAITTDAFQQGVFRGNTSFLVPYRLLSPLPVKDKRYPLVIVFHGSGAVGSDNTKQLGFLARSWADADMRQRFPAFVLVPQFPSRSSNYDMDPGRQVLTSKVQPPVYTVLALIDSLKSVLPVDTSRIYLQGFSMGASTVLNAMSLRPGFFAAGVAFSGIADLKAQEILKHTPLWIIHGNADTENTFASDSLFYREMKANGAKHIRLWEIDGMAHELPLEMISNGTFAAWLFSKKRKH